MEVAPMHVRPTNPGMTRLRGTVSATTRTYFHLTTSSGETVRIDKSPSANGVKKGDKVIVENAELEKAYTGYFLKVRQEPS
jgi:hypothetical protein